MNDQKIPGLESRTNKRTGKTVYRICTHLNGVNTKTAWTTLEKTIKHNTKLQATRVKMPVKNQHTVVENDMRVSELLEKFHVYAKTRYSPNTYLDLKQNYNLILKKYLNLQISELSKINLIDEFNTGICRNTAEKRVAKLKMLQSFAEANDYPFKFNSKKLMQNFHNYPASEENIKFLSKNDVNSIYKCIDDYIAFNVEKLELLEKIKIEKPNTKKIEKHLKFYNRQIDNFKNFKLMVTIALYAGLRVGEIFGLRNKDIDLENKIINVNCVQCKDKSIKYSTKNGTTRIVPMYKKIQLALTEKMKNSNNPDSRIFEGYTYAGWLVRRMEYLRKNNGLDPKYTFHTLRHTFASIYFKLHGTDKDVLVDLQEIMGHSSFDMTLHYVHLYKTYKGNLLDGLSFNEAEKVEDIREEKEKQNLINATVSIKVLDDQLRVEAPYAKEMILKYEELGGVYNKENRCWVFHPSAEQEVKNLLKEKFEYLPELSIEDKLNEVQKQLATLISLSKQNGNSQRIS